MRKLFTYKTGVAIAIMLFFTGSLLSQIQLKHMPGMNNGSYLPQRTCFELVNSGSVMQGVINIKIKSMASDSVVLEVESAPIDIAQGTIQVLPAFIEKFKTQNIKNEAFTSPLNLKMGDYLAEATIKPKGEDIDIAYLLIPISVTQDNNKTDKPDKLISTSGTASVLGVLGTRQQSLSTLPPNYVQAILDPSVTIYGVPVSAHVTLSTAQSSQSQPLNTFSFSYNNTALKNLLRSKLQSAIAKNADFQKLVDLKNSADLNKYTKYKKTLENPDVKKELTELTSIDSLAHWKDTLTHYKNIYKNLSLKDTATTLFKEYLIKYTDTTTALKELTKHLPVDSSKMAMYRDSIGKIIDKADKVVDKYNKLKAKKDGYEKLINNKEELEKKLKSLSLIDSLGNSIDNLKNKLEDTKNKVQQVHDNIDNPKYFIDKLRENHLLKPLDKVMLAINKIELGTSYPSISPYTLNGVRVNGINVEVAPGNLYVAGTYGTILNAVQTFNPQQASYKRKLWSSTVGYGAPDKSHLHFTVLSATDDSSSITPRDSIFETVKLPQSNYILSSHFKLKLFKDKVTLFGELAGSQTTRDIQLNNPDSNAYYAPQVNLGNAKDWVRNIITQKNSNSNTTVSYAYTSGIEATMFKGLTKLTNTVKRVGSDFKTFGVPFLVTDMFTIESKLTQKIWKNRIQAGVTVKHNTDNLNEAKLITTKNYQFGGELKIAIPKWPTVKVNYLPVMYQNDSAKVDIKIFNVNINHQYKIKRVKNVITMAYVQQRLVSSDILLNYNSTNALLSHTTFFPKSISIIASANYIRFNNSATPNINTINISLSTGFSMFKKKLNNTLGATLIKNRNEQRYGFFYTATIAVNKHLSANLRIENNQYNSYVVSQVLTVPYFSEFISQLSLAIKW